MADSALPRGRFRFARFAEEPMVAEGDGSPAASPTTALAILIRLLKESAEYGRYFVRAKLAQLQLTLSTVLLFTAVGLAAGLAGLAMIITAGVLLVKGLAELLSAILGHHAWAGDILTGLIVLVGVIAGTYFGIRFATKGLRSGLAESLEELRRQQRESFGTDVRERSGNLGESHVGDRI